MVGGTWKREWWPGTQCFILFLAWDSLLSLVKVKSISSGLSFPINWVGYECWHFNVLWFTGESSSSQAGRSPQPGSQTSKWLWLWYLCHCRLCELDSLTPDSCREGGYSGVSNNDVSVNNRPPVSQYITDLKLCIISCFYCVFFIFRRV